jgi:hypothetical protein
VVFLTVMTMMCVAQTFQRMAWAQHMGSSGTSGLQQTLGEIPEDFKHRRDSPHFSQEAPPLRTLMERHGWLNLHCFLQEYALRGSFFRYLSNTFSQEAVLRLACSDDEMTPALFAQVFGHTFEALEQDWRAQAVRAFEARADGAHLARAYRNTLKDFYICQAGKDY